MEIKWTNIHGMPLPMEMVIKQGLYHKKREAALQEYIKKHSLEDHKIIHFSATDLVRPTQQAILSLVPGQAIVQDVSSQAFSLLGTLFHNLFRDKAIEQELALQGYSAEVRLFRHSFSPDGESVFVVSGEPDLVGPDGTIYDYKTTAVYSWQKGFKLEWEQQMNIYAWLRQPERTDKLVVAYMLRDWNLRETVKDGYPLAPALTEEIPLWTESLQEEFVRSRIESIVSPGEVECSPEEMWEKPSSYAVLKKGGKRAVKVWREEEFGENAPEGTPHALDAAEAHAKDMTNKTGIEHSVEHRPGERTRCEFFCQVRSICPQFKEYASATTGVMKRAVA